MSKPKIKKVYGGGWYCSDDQRTGDEGATPLLAYDRWQSRWSDGLMERLSKFGIPILRKPFPLCTAGNGA